MLFVSIFLASETTSFSCAISTLISTLVFILNSFVWLQHNSQGRRDSDKLEAPDIKKPQGSLSHKLGLLFFWKNTDLQIISIIFSWTNLKNLESEFWTMKIHSPMWNLWGFVLKRNTTCHIIRLTFVSDWEAFWFHLQWCISSLCLMSRAEINLTSFCQVLDMKKSYLSKPSSILNWIHWCSEVFWLRTEGRLKYHYSVWWMDYTIQLTDQFFIVALLHQLPALDYTVCT